MKTIISAESTIDLTDELKKKYGIKTVPFTILLGDEQLQDGKVSCEDIIEYVKNKKTLPKTSAVNEYQYEEHFSSLLKDFDAVVHFSLSDKLSSAYRNAVKASEKFKNVYVIDTESLSTGIALLAIYGAELVQSGADAKSVYEKCLKRVPSVQASFVLERLDFLYRGGRCGSLLYFGANILKIRPQIIVSEGKMSSGKKYRGTIENVVEKYCADTLEEFGNPDLHRAFVTYTTANPKMIETAKKALADRGFKNIEVTTAGGTITSHCGEHCLGILYINDGGTDGRK